MYCSNTTGPDICTLSSLFSDDLLSLLSFLKLDNEKDSQDWMEMARGERLVSSVKFHLNYMEGKFRIDLQ